MSDRSFSCYQRIKSHNDRHLAFRILFGFNSIGPAIWIRLLLSKSKGLSFDCVIHNYNYIHLMKSSNNARRNWPKTPQKTVATLLSSLHHWILCQLNGTRRMCPVHLHLYYQFCMDWERLNFKCQRAMAFSPRKSVLFRSKMLRLSVSKCAQKSMLPCGENRPWALWHTHTHKTHEKMYFFHISHGGFYIYEPFRYAQGFISICMRWNYCDCIFISKERVSFKRSRYW